MARDEEVELDWAIHNLAKGVVWLLWTFVAATVLTLLGALFVLCWAGAYFVGAWNG